MPIQIKKHNKPNHGPRKQGQNRVTRKLIKSRRITGGSPIYATPTGNLPKTSQTPPNPQTEYGTMYPLPETSYSQTSQYHQPRGLNSKSRPNLQNLYDVPNQGKTVQVNTIQFKSDFAMLIEKYLNYITANKISITSNMEDLKVDRNTLKNILGYILPIGQLAQKIDKEKDTYCNLNKDDTILFSNLYYSMNKQNYNFNEQITKTTPNEPKKTSIGFFKKFFGRTRKNNKLPNMHINLTAIYNSHMCNYEKAIKVVEKNSKYCKVV